MDESSSNSYRNHGRNVEVMNGEGRYAAYRAYAGKPQQYNPSGHELSTTSKSSKGESLFNNRELKRRKRVVKYKWYAVEGKIKAALKNSLRIFKRKCSRIVHGF